MIILDGLSQDIKSNKIQRQMTCSSIIFIASK